jgi:hypothetical protein
MELLLLLSYQRVSVGTDRACLLLRLVELATTQSHIFAEQYGTCTVVKHYEQ